MVTVVYAHPYVKSFNHAILEKIMDRLNFHGAEFTLLDLYADDFHPAIHAEDLALYGTGDTKDPLAKKYMSVLKNTEHLIYIYPVWWGVEPAIVQGFYDKTLLKDFAWKYSEDGRLLPMLHIKNTLIFTTSEAPGVEFEAYFNKYLPEHVFAAVGMGNPHWYNLGGITRSTDTQRSEFLDFAARKIDSMLASS